MKIISKFFETVLTIPMLIMWLIIASAWLIIRILELFVSRAME